jgi:hypothetical protein
MKNFELLKFIQQYEIIIGSSIVILVLIILIGTLLLPNYYNVQEIYFKQEPVKKKLEILKKKDAVIANTNIGKFSQAMPKILKIIPSSKDYVSLFLRLDQLQNDSGITVSRANFQLGAISSTSATLKYFTGTTSYIIPMDFDISGTSSQLKRFFELLSDLSGRYITIESVNWAFSKNDIIKVNFSAKTFFQPESNQKFLVETPLKVVSSEKEAILDKIISVQQEDVAIDYNNSDVKVGKQNLFK